VSEIENAMRTRGPIGSLCRSGRHESAEDSYEETIPCLLEALYAEIHAVSAEPVYSKRRDIEFGTPGLEEISVDLTQGGCELETMT
jgi:hypothetical protein